MEEVRDDAAGLPECRVDDPESRRRIEERLPRLVADPPEIPRSVMEGPGLMSGNEGLTPDLQDSIDLEGHLPWHRQVLECGMRYHEVDAARRYMATELVSIGDYVHVLPCDDIEPDVFRRLAQLGSVLGS